MTQNDSFSGLKCPKEHTLSVAAEPPATPPSPQNDTPDGDPSVAGHPIAARPLPTGHFACRFVLLSVTCHSEQREESHPHQGGSSPPLSVTIKRLCSLSAVDLTKTTTRNVMTRPQRSAATTCLPTSGSFEGIPGSNEQAAMVGETCQGRVARSWQPPVLVSAIAHQDCRRIWATAFRFARPEAGGLIRRWAVPSLLREPA